MGEEKKHKVSYIDAGGCNGCYIEIIAALYTKYNPEKINIEMVGSPGQADILIVTGPVNTRNKEDVLKDIEQAQEPKKIMVVGGGCGISEGIFKGSYNTRGPLDELEEVDLYLPECPVKPQSVIEGLKILVEELDKEED